MASNHESHASVGFYWMIAGILGVITAMEVAIFYIPAIGGETLSHRRHTLR